MERKEDEPIQMEYLEDRVVDSISNLLEMEDDAVDHHAVGLYRAMFKHITDVDYLDYNYADWLFDGVITRNKNAIEDYKNYIQYLKAFNEDAYIWHKNQLENELQNQQEENER